MSSVRPISTARRTRAQIVAENDRALREAVADMVWAIGWDGVTFSGVAKRAGLTVGAVYGRAENSAELAIDLWENAAAEWFADRVAGVIAAAQSGDPEAVAQQLYSWDGDERMTAVVVELLIASLFDPDLAEVIGAEARAIIEPLVTPSPSAPRVTRHEAAAAVLTLSFTLGRAVAIRGGVAPAELSAAQFGVLAGAYGAQRSVGAIPKPVPLRWIQPMIDIDLAQQAVLQGTIDVIGRVGYRRATIARIARSAGVPRGSVLSHYPDKAHLVADAAERGLLSPDQVWEEYAPVVEKHGRLTSRAMFLADFLKPENRTLWAVNLELARTARLVPELVTFQPSAGVLGQTHLGVMLVAALSPDLSELPFAGPFNAGSAT